MTERMLIDLLISRIEIAVEQLESNRSLSALNVLKSALNDLAKVSLK